MMPDGADPCEGYQQLQRELAAKTAECTELRSLLNRINQSDMICAHPDGWMWVRRIDEALEKP
jgi:hypothetical protein